MVTDQHKMRNMVWTKGTSALDGEFQSASEVDFYIDKVYISTHIFTSAKEVMFLPDFVCLSVCL